MSDCPDPELRDRRAQHRRRRATLEPDGTLEAELAFLEARDTARQALAQWNEADRLMRVYELYLVELERTYVLELLRESYGPAP